MFIVTGNATRPAGPNDKCFYCWRPIGEPHCDDCVFINKRVAVRMIIDYTIAVPVNWDSDQIEFMRNEGCNEGSWCVDNALDELQEIIDREGCLCGCTEFQYIGDVSKPFLECK